MTTLTAISLLAAVAIMSVNSEPIIGGFSHLYGVGLDNIHYGDGFGAGHGAGYGYGGYGSGRAGYALGVAGYGFYGPEVISVGPGYVDYGAPGADAFGAVKNHGHPGVFLAAASAPETTRVPAKEGAKVKDDKAKSA